MHPVDQIQGMLISMYAFQGQLNNYKINRLSLIVQVNIVVNVVDSDWRFDDLCGSHIQSQKQKFFIACSSQDSFAYSESLQHPTITILLIEIFFDHSVVFSCSKAINAFKR